jgi:hypothetical protein
VDLVESLGGNKAEYRKGNKVEKNVNIVEADKKAMSG